jgi:hypothetical protein
VGLNVTYLAVLSVAYFLIAVIVDFSIANPWLRRRILGVKMPSVFSTSSPIVSPHEDVDVAAERARVAQGGDPSDVLTLKARALLVVVVALCSCVCDVAWLPICRAHTQHPVPRVPPPCHSLCCVPPCSIACEHRSCERCTTAARWRCGRCPSACPSASASDSW